MSCCGRCFVLVLCVVGFFVVKVQILVRLHVYCFVWLFYIYSQILTALFVFFSLLFFCFALFLQFLAGGNADSGSFDSFFFLFFILHSNSC